MDVTPVGILVDLLRRHAVAVEELSRKETWAHQQRWRECYSACVKARTGMWTYGAFDWNTFAFGFARCLRDAKALAAYGACPAEEFLVIPEPNKGPGLRCSAESPPDLSSSLIEVYVFPTDLDWTMVFTHEGQFFSRRTWVEQQARD